MPTPSYFDVELIHAIAELPSRCQYVDIGRDNTRHESPNRSLPDNLLGHLLAAAPCLVLLTTFVLGFLGETDDVHAEMLRFGQDSPVSGW